MRVLLTGAASGIGAAIARRLWADGVGIVALDLRSPELADRWIQTNLGDSKSVEKALVEIRAEKAPFDTLINAAGIAPAEDNAAEVLAVNWLGLRQLTEGILPLLADGASVLSIASRAGAGWRRNLEEVRALMQIENAEDLPSFVAERAINPFRAYELSKEAIILWTKLLTPRLHPMGLRINSISPAAVATPLLEGFATDMDGATAAAFARADRPGLPEEIAELAVFLAGPKSNWVKGQDIVIDGGISAMMLAEKLAP